MLSLSNAAVTAVSGWFQGKIQEGEFAYWMIFLATGLPPLVTALVGFLNIPEERLPPSKHSQSSNFQWRGATSAAFRRLRSAPAYLSALGKENKLMMILVLFIVLWNFSPSVGYIERSYLIDARGFTPEHFGARPLTSPESWTIERSSSAVVYISLVFTLLTIPVMVLLKRTLARNRIEITNEAEEKQQQSR